MKIRKTLMTMLTAVAICMAASSANAALLVQVDDDGSTDLGDPLPVALAAAGLSSTPATQVGLSPFTNVASWPVGVLGAAFDAGQYVSVTITPDSGNTIDFTDVVWDKGFFDAGSGTVRTSLDTFASDVSSFVDNGGNVSFDLTSLGTVSGPIEFRFHFLRGAGFGFADLGTNNGAGSDSGLQFNGNVNVIPEPTSAALLLTGFAAVFCRRSRR